MASAWTIAGWAYDAGFQTAGVLTDAVALALAYKGDENSPQGTWGVGGKVGDGPSQAAAARALYMKSQWNDFPAHKSAVWQFYRPGSATVAGSMIAYKRGQDAAKGVGTVVDTASKAVDSAGNAVDQVGSALHVLTTRQTWVRVAQVAIGGGLVIVAIVMVLSGSPVGEAAKSTAGKAKKVAKTTAEAAAIVAPK